MNAIFEYFLRIRYSSDEMFRVVIELLLIGIIVYWAISFLEGTRGERLFKGVILVIIFGILTLDLVVKRFGLVRIEYLINGFALTAFFVVAIAFQPEIRRALMSIGQAGFLMSSPQQLSRTVEEIINAVTQLAATRTGAILVIQQQVGLAEFIETGVRIDSKVTAELMKTIFYPGTALHDMAIVIQGDRIVAARVQLPLAEASAVDGQELGSRHRAAIGVTSSSDAMVIVVSEETGIISLAIDGNLVRNISESQLRKHLTSAVVETTPLVERIQENKMSQSSSKTKSADKS